MHLHLRLTYIIFTVLAHSWLIPAGLKEKLFQRSFMKSIKGQSAWTSQTLYNVWISWKQQQLFNWLINICSSDGVGSCVSSPRAYSHLTALLRRLLRLLPTFSPGKILFHHLWHCRLHDWYHLWILPVPRICERYGENGSGYESACGSSGSPSERSPWLVYVKHLISSYHISSSYIILPIYF